jgi:hypothetical protein
MSMTSYFYPESKDAFQETDLFHVEHDILWDSGNRAPIAMRLRVALV